MQCYVCAYPLIVYESSDTYKDNINTRDCAFTAANDILINYLFGVKGILLLVHKYQAFIQTCKCLLVASLYFTLWCFPFVCFCKHVVLFCKFVPNEFTWVLQSESEYFNVKTLGISWNTHKMPRWRFMRRLQYTSEDRSVLSV